MPHDSKNRELKIGDRVHLVGHVTALSQSDGYCNCSIRLEHLMPPENTPVDISSINTRQLERAEPADREQNDIDAKEKAKVDKERADRTAKDAHGKATANQPPLKTDKYGNPVKE